MGKYGSGGMTKLMPSPSRSDISRESGSATSREMRELASVLALVRGWN